MMELDVNIATNKEVQNNNNQELDKMIPVEVLGRSATNNEFNNDQNINMEEVMNYLGNEVGCDTAGASTGTEPVEMKETKKRGRKQAGVKSYQDKNKEFKEAGMLLKRKVWDTLTDQSVVQSNIEIIKKSMLHFFNRYQIEYCIEPYPFSDEAFTNNGIECNHYRCIPIHTFYANDDNDDNFDYNDTKARSLINMLSEFTSRLLTQQAYEILRNDESVFTKSENYPIIYDRIMHSIFSLKVDDIYGIEKLANELRPEIEKICKDKAQVVVVYEPPDDSEEYEEFDDESEDDVVDELDSDHSEVDPYELYV